jgi:Trypsin-co-occurring domain 1
MRSYLVDVPVEHGGRLLVEATAVDVPDDLELAGPSETVRRATRTLEEALDDVGPALGVVLDRLAATGPKEISVEFGLALSLEVGAVVAKGSSEVHFTVTMTWERQDTPATGSPPRP